MVVCSVGGAAAWRCGTGGRMVAWRVLQRDSVEGVTVWRFGWQGKGERNEERENEMRESDQTGEVGIMGIGRVDYGFFFFKY